MMHYAGPDPVVHDSPPVVSPHADGTWSKQCPVCLEPIILPTTATTGAMVSQYGCGHMVHRACMVHHLRVTPTAGCPWRCTTDKPASDIDEALRHGLLEVYGIPPCGCDRTHASTAEYDACPHRPTMCSRCRTTYMRSQQHECDAGEDTRDVCPHDGCRQVIDEANLMHASTCVYRPWTCEGCKTTMPRQMRSGHRRKCKAQVPCNVCAAVLARVHDADVKATHSVKVSCPIRAVLDYVKTHPEFIDDIDTRVPEPDDVLDEYAAANLAT